VNLAKLVDVEHERDRLLVRTFGQVLQEFLFVDCLLAFGVRDGLHVTFLDGSGLCLLSLAVADDRLERFKRLVLILSN